MKLTAILIVGIMLSLSLVTAASVNDRTGDSDKVAKQITKRYDVRTGSTTGLTLQRTQPTKLDIVRQTRKDLKEREKEAAKRKVHDYRNNLNHRLKNPAIFAAKNENPGHPARAPRRMIKVIRGTSSLHEVTPVSEVSGTRVKGRGYGRTFRREITIPQATSVGFYEDVPLRPESNSIYRR